MLLLKEFVRFHTEAKSIQKQTDKIEKKTEKMPLQSRYVSSDTDDNDEKPITVTASHSLPPLVARYVTLRLIMDVINMFRCPTPVGDRQKRSITTIAEQIAKKVKTSQIDEIGKLDNMSKAGLNWPYFYFHPISLAPFLFHH